MTNGSEIFKNETMTSLEIAEVPASDTLMYLKLSEKWNQLGRK